MIESDPAATVKPPAMFNVPRVVLAVIGLLIAVHLGLWALGQDWQVWSLYALSFIPARFGGPEMPAFPQGAQYWSFVTSALLHADVYHLASNSFWLLVFSTPIARRWGSLRYVIFCILSAAAGSAAMLIAHWQQFIIVVGASGIVSAALAAAVPIMFAEGFSYGRTSDVGYKRLKVLTPQQLLNNYSALIFTAVFLAMTLLSGASQTLSGTAFLEERSIAWQAHLGGFIAGFILFYLLDRWKVPATTKS
jgi:membrane associated rhomboid family serine protease